MKVKNNLAFNLESDKVVYNLQLSLFVHTPHCMIILCVIFTLKKKNLCLVQIMDEWIHQDYATKDNTA